MRTRTWMLALLLPMFAAGVALAEDQGQFYKDVLSAVEREKEGLWKKINWESDPAKALERARDEGKPLLVFTHHRAAFNFDPRPEAC